MCTVTIVPRSDGFRLTCNRDERRDRVPARPPSVQTICGIQAMLPCDPQGGGTWIGVNSTGLAAVLLNRNDTTRVRPRPTARFSRGAIVPPLLGFRCITDALRAARRVNAAAFDPFRIVLIQGSTCAAVSSSGAALSIAAHSVARPLMFTSSSLGDVLVAGPRRRLFEQHVLSASDVEGWLEGQRRFHEHRWDDRPHVSVLMSRADARTVSRTVVDVCRSFATLRYEPLDDGGAGRVIAVGRAA